MPGSAVRRLDLPKEEKCLIILIVIDRFSLKSAIQTQIQQTLFVPEGQFSSGPEKHAGRVRERRIAIKQYAKTSGSIKI